MSVLKRLSHVEGSCHVEEYWVHLLIWATQVGFILIPEKNHANLRWATAMRGNGELFLLQCESHQYTKRKVCSYEYMTVYVFPVSILHKHISVHDTSWRHLFIQDIPTLWQEHQDRLTWTWGGETYFVCLIPYSPPPFLLNFMCIFSRARICKPFKAARNRFPAWRACTTTLFVGPSRHEAT